MAGDPDTATPPRCRIAISWHRASASSIRCVVGKIVVLKFALSFINRSQTEFRAMGSSPTVGSSRKSTGGRCSIACAISSRRIMPPEYSRTSRFAAASNSINASASAMRAARSPRGMS